MDLEYVELEDGTQRSLGNIHAPLAKAWTVYGDTPNTPLMLRPEWPIICAAMTPGPESDYLPPNHDQDGVGMCNCSATAGGMESQRMKQGLTPYIPLSAGDLYHRIAVGGRDNGSLLEDGIHAATTEGIASVAVVPYLDWQRNHGDAAVQDRKRFRVLEAFLCPTFDHCYSAVAHGFDLISGVPWFSNYTPGPDGRLPPGRGNSGGHAIHGYKPAWIDGKPHIWHQQSWGPSWGPLAGKFAMGEQCYTQAIGGWWAIRLVVDEGGVIPPKK